MGIVSATGPVRDRMIAELERLSPFAGDPDAGAALGHVRARAEELLRRIERGIREGAILPWSFVRLSEAAPFPPLVGCAPNIGVFPVAASPLQWGHIIAALAAMAALGLDHIVFIVTDDAERRHVMAADVLARFAPLLLYSAVDSFFDFLRLNARQPMKVHFLCGSAPTGARERVAQELAQAMRDGAHDYDPWTHPVSLVFFNGDGDRKAPPLSLPSVEVELPLPDPLPQWPATTFAGHEGHITPAAIPCTSFRPGFCRPASPPR
jgi:hypothetical protein